MTARTPYPEANPFNERRFGNYNVHKAAAGGYIGHTGKDAKNLTVPNQDQPMYGTPEYEAKYGAFRRLTVPDTAPDAMLGAEVPQSGFVPGRSDLFMTYDGAVLDFKTGRVVRQAPARPEIRHIGNAPGLGEWGITPSIEQLIAGTGGGGQYDPNMDEYSRKYWEMAVSEARKMEAGLTPEQKASLAAFEAHFPLSKLIDESKKS